VTVTFSEIDAGLLVTNYDAYAHARLRLLLQGQVYFQFGHT